MPTIWLTLGGGHLHAYRLLGSGCVISQARSASLIPPFGLLFLFSKNPDPMPWGAKRLYGVYTIMIPYFLNLLYIYIF